jgi:hypothetical protein
VCQGDFVEVGEMNGLHKSEEEDDSHTPLRLLAELHVPEVHDWCRSIELSMTVSPRNWLRVGEKSSPGLEKHCW